MRINHKFLSLFLLTVFFMNISSLAIVFTLNDNQTTSNVSLTSLRGEPGVYFSEKNLLLKNSNDISSYESTGNNSSSDVALYQNPIRYAIEDGVEDDVDSNTSDIDSSSDVGIETNFDNAQGTSVDSQYMQVQEELGSPPTIQIDSISTNSNTSNYFSHNHTISGINRLLVVTVQTNGGTAVDNVTFGGQTLDSEWSVSHTTGGSPSIEIFSLLAPPTGTADVIVYLVNSISDEVTIGVISYVGVDQTTPIDGQTDFEGNSKTPSITVSSRVGDWVQDAMASLSDKAPDADSEQTIQWSEEMGGSGTSTYYGVGSTKNGNTSVTTGWTLAKLRRWVIIGFNIRRAPSPYVLDLEYQWTNAEFTKLERELAIYTGDLDSEDLKVDVWSGSTWVTIIDSLNANDWNNISVVPYLTSSTFTIRLKGADDINDESSDVWNIDLLLLVTSPENNLPRAENLTLTPDPLYGNETLTLDYDYTDQDGDLESGTEILWYKWNLTDSIWNLISAYNGESQITSSALFKGDTWKVTVKPHDGIEYGNVTSSSNITVQNLPPQLSSVIVLPSNPLTTSTLMVSYSYSDPDSDSEITGDREILWYRNGSLLVGFADSITIPANMINKSETWYYEIRAFDGSNYSNWELSNTVTIKNSIPTALNVNLTVNPNTNTDLNAIYNFSDNDLDAEQNWIIQWFRNNGTGDELQGYLDDLKTVEAGNTTRGEVWYYTLKVFDGTNYSILYTSPSRSIVNEAPTASNYNITQAPYTTTDLQANWTYSDLENDPEGTWIITWYKDGEIYTTGTQTMIAAAATSKGEVWNYTLKVFDGIDYSIQYNSTSVQILNSLPTLSDITITNNPPTGEDVIAGYTFQDVDGDTENSFQIIWYKNNIVQPGITTLTLSSSETMKGETWNFTLTVSDGENNSIQYNSSITIIINSLPYITPINPSFNKTNPSADDTINITYTYNDADNTDNPGTDNEVTGNRLIYWYNKGVYNSSKDDDTILLSSETVEGDAWQYIIAVHDGHEYSINFTSEIVFIGAGSNSVPTAENITLNANTNKTTEELVASYDYADSDGLPIPSDIEIRWYKNNALQINLNDSMEIDSSLTTKNENWNFTLRVYDGFNWSMQYYSSILTIINSLPEASDLTISSSPFTTDNVSIGWIFDDNDTGDAEVSYNVIWLIDGVSNSTFNNMKEIDSSYTNKGEVWNYTLTIFDGEDNSIVYNSTSITIKNSVPSVSDFILTENPTTTIDLVASWTITDADTGDSITYNITWYRYGLIYQSWLTTSISATLNSGNTSKNENWYYNIQAYDGESYSLLGAPSPNRQILNTAPVILGGIVDINPSSPIRGTSLTVIYDLTDVDNDSEVGTQIRWFKDDILQPSFNDLTNVPGSEVVKGQQWHVQVTGGDGTSFSIPINSTQILIGNTAPVVDVDSLSLFPTIAYTTSTLVASYAGTDIDSDLITEFRIVWLNESVEVPGLENSTEISPIYTKKGQEWTFQVMLYDGTDWSLPETLGLEVDILNSKPRIENISITGGLNTTDNIILTYDFIDPDGDMDATVIDWTIIHLGGLGPNAPSDVVVDNTLFTAGDFIFCSMQPYDGIHYGDALKSKDFDQFITVGNSDPELLSQPNIFNSDEIAAFFASKDLIVNYSAADPDQGESYDDYWIDLDNTNYRWYQNGELRSDLTGPTVLASNLNKGDKWIVSVQPVDQFGGYGSWGNSSEITILNSKISILEIWFENGNTEQELIDTTYANVTLFIDFDYADIDGVDNPVFEIFWYWNNGNGTFVLRADLGNQTQEIFDIIKNQEWYVVMRLFDGEEWSTSKNSSIIKIINSLPIITSWEYAFENIDVDPNTRVDEFFIEDENLRILYIYSDFDNDSSYTLIKWFKQIDDLWIEMTAYENMTTIPSVNTTAGDMWFASIIPFDGSNEGMPMNSSYITVISRPDISEPVFTPELDKDGKYNITMEVTDSSNSPSLMVVIEIITFNSSFSLNGSNTHSDYWYFSIDMLNWLNTNISINIQAYSTFDSNFDLTYHIFTNKSFTLYILDEAPPRVLETHHQQDLGFNPTNITIFAIIEEFGSDIKEITLFYTFSVGSSSFTGSSSQFDEEFSLKMEFHNTTGENAYYKANIDLDFDQDVTLSYRIQTEDQAGKIEPYAFIGFIDLRYNIKAGEESLDLLIAGIIGTLAISLAVGSGYIFYRRKSDKKRSRLAIVNSKLSFLSDTYMVLVTSAAGVPIWSITNTMYQSDNSLEDNLSGLSVGIDSFLESFQSDFLSQVTAYDVSRDQIDRETNFKLSVIEQNKIQIMIVGSASYRIFVFLKELPSEFLRGIFLRIIKDLQLRLPIHDLGIINENILGPNVRMIIRRHVPIGLLAPFKIDIDRLNQVDSILQQGLEDIPITKGGVNTLKLLILAARSTHITIKSRNSLLKLYNKSDYAEKYSGIFLFTDGRKILSRIPGLSIEDICEAFWSGIADKVKIILPV